MQREQVADRKILRRIRNVADILTNSNVDGLTKQKKYVS
jgi:hypothetical protein